MENGEEAAQDEYELLAKEVEESAKIKQDEEAHEAALLEMLDEFFGRSIMVGSDVVFGGSDFFEFLVI